VSVVLFFRVNRHYISRNIIFISSTSLQNNLFVFCVSASSSDSQFNENTDVIVSRRSFYNILVKIGSSDGTGML
jgi:hypothetical protein